MLTEIDLLEISAVSKPAHPATMALSWKTADNRNGIPSVIPSVEDLRRRERSLGLGVKDEAYAHTLAVLGHQPARPTRTAAKSTDTRPIRVASFEC